MFFFFVFLSIGFFAKRTIEANEELCYDYGEAQVDDSLEESCSEQAPRKLCYCGTEKCRKYLPNLKISEEDKQDSDDEEDDEYEESDDDEAINANNN